jgi:hypothetical protein
VPTLERLDTRALRDVITTFRDTVRQHAGGLNRLNVYPVPDGDTGTNMARTLDAVVAEMETTSEEDLDATFLHTSDELVVLVLGALHPEHVVEEKVVVVRGGQPLKTQLGTVHHHLPQSSHL